MEFAEAGPYKITASKLREMGFESSAIDPRNIAIYGMKGGMLPQSLEEEWHSDLVELAIEVNGESDGIFNEADEIIFYVDEVHPIELNEVTRQFYAEKNLYSEHIYYYLTVKTESGLRIENILDLGANHAVIDWYNHITSHEEDERNLLSSGREWLGEEILDNPLSFDIDLAGLKTDQDIRVSIDIVGQSFSSSSLQVDLAGNNIGNLEFSSIPNTQYGIKANVQEGNFDLAASQLGGSTSAQLILDYDRNGSSTAVAYLNKFLIDLPRTLNFSGEPLVIRNAYMTDNMLSSFVLSSSIDLVIWDVTNSITPSNQQYQRDGNDLIFGTFTDTQKTFVGFDTNSLPEPEAFEEVSNQNLNQVNNDLVIITHEDFMVEAERLASFRSNNDQMSVLVATVDQIYNQFSAGRQDISAIRNFIRSQYDGGLKYALLFGKGSYDYKDRIDGNSNFVPTYESRNSIHPLLTYSSDDFFAFLDDNEGEWTESINGDHLMDIGIGRIPVTTIDQAKKAVDKIILYQTDSNVLGDWRSKLLFVADDGDRNIHQRDADILARTVDTRYPEYQVKKLYLDAFEQDRLPNGEVSPDAANALTEFVNEGALIVNFTGHGAESGWMQERILTFDLMEEWNNTYTLPLLVTATCEFGRNDDPDIFSGAENLMFKNVGGAIALVTTARPVFSSTNFRLNEALYEAILEQPGGQYQRLGDIIQFTKNNSLQGSLNRNFILLGDPSMRLTYPSKKIEITSINDRPVSDIDTLKALQRVRMAGQVTNGNQLDTNFSGTLKFSLFDKETRKRTLGTDSDPFDFGERDSELVRGQVSVTNGQFQLEFIIPRNIDYSFGEGKISMYASSTETSDDAIGANLDFILGGSESNPLNDTTPPDIRVFANDTTQAIQGTYDSDVNFIVKLFDESGINISESGIGQDITLTLNDSITFNLNKSYLSELDALSKGVAQIEIEDMSQGRNEIVIQAWDIFGNSNTLVQEIYIEENTSYISVINNHPNPFTNETTFNIEHSLERENIEVGIEIRNINGEPITAIYQEFLSADATVSIQWSGTNNFNQALNPGVYIYSINLYSKTSGKSGSKRQKLIISN